MRKTDQLLKIIADNPGSWIELGTVWLFLDDFEKHENNRKITLSSKLRATKKEVTELLEQITKDAVQVWANDAEVEKSIDKGEIPELITVYRHPLAGYFEISGGGMSPETMSFISKEEFEQRTKHGK